MNGRWGNALLLVAGLSLTILASLGADRARALKNERHEGDVLYMPAPEALKIASIGYDDIVADLLWLRTVTYYGEWRRGEHGISAFHRLADTVTELDPNFGDAYRFAGMVMAEDMGNPDEGIRILEKGMQNMPDNWWLPFEAGFIEYTVHMDDRAAAEWFQKAAAVPDAPDYPRRFAAFVTSRAGDLSVSHELWSYIAQTTINKDLRAKALEYMQELEAAIEGTGPVPEWATRKRVIQTQAGVEG